MNKKSIPSIVIILSSFLMLYVYSKITDFKIRYNPIITVGVITEYVSFVYNGNPFYEYEFNYKGVKYKSKKTAEYEKELFKGHKFPVIFEKDNPGNSRLLIFPKNFEEFGLSFPDSLSWVVIFE